MNGVLSVIDAQVGFLLSNSGINEPANGGKGGIKAPDWKNSEDGSLRLRSAARRCCRTQAAKDSHQESLRLDETDEQAHTCPLPHDELVQLQRYAQEAPLQFRQCNSQRNLRQNPPTRGAYRSVRHHTFKDL